MLSGLSGYVKGVKKAIGNIGTAHQATPTLGRIRIGSRNIEEIKLISQGGYAYVFQVRDSQTGEIFALKKMICQSEERVQTAKNEIKYLRALPEHPNLLKVYDTHVDNKDGCYYVYVLLEFCADGSIFDLMAKYESTRLAEKQIIFIMREVCEGVKALHSMRPPIAHRDLKIENVLLNNKRFKLCDFGSCSTSIVDFAKVPQSQYHTYEEEYDKNTTLMYRPPEMCDPYQKLIVSEKADVWMIGCILYTMCFYKHPFQECSKLSIVNAAYTFPKEHNYAPKLIDLIRLCLTPNPNTRPNIFDVCKIFDNYFELNSIKLNPDAQRIKEEQRKQEQEMNKFENKSANIPKFNGDIPVHELMKLQQQLAHDDDSSPVHVRHQVQNKMSHKQNSHGKLHSHKNSSDFDSFGDSSFKPKTQVPDANQFHSSPGLGQGNNDWFNFDDKPKNQNHQTTQQSSFASSSNNNQQLKANSQVNSQWQNFDFGSTPSSNQQPNNNNNNNNNQWASFNQTQNQQQVKPQNQMGFNTNNTPQMQQGFNQQGQGGWNQNQNQNQNMMNKNIQMNQFNSNGWNQNQNQNMMNRNQQMNQFNSNGWNQNTQMQNNFQMQNNMNRMPQQQSQSQVGWNNQPNMQNFNSQNGFQQQNNTTTVTNNLLDLADTKPVRLDTASGIMSLYANTKK